MGAFKSGISLTYNSSTQNREVAICTLKTRGNWTNIFVIYNSILHEQYGHRPDITVVGERIPATFHSPGEGLCGRPPLA